MGLRFAGYLDPKKDAEETARLFQEQKSKQPKFDFDSYNSLAQLPRVPGR